MIMAMPLVTLGMPVYAGGEDFRETLQSIAHQTYPNIEILIAVDNGDLESAEIARPFLADPRYRLHIQSERLGWDGNADWTMRHSRGDFYIYHQHDDHVSPTYVADLVAPPDVTQRPRFFTPNVGRRLHRNNAAHAIVNGHAGRASARAFGAS